MKNKKVVVVGGGPAGLFASFLLLEKGFQVELYDHSSGFAKKFLIAGNGGLNLTHSEDLESFAKRYGKDEKLFSTLLEEFSPSDLRLFCESLGIETFVGTSGRVFPKNLKAAKILLSWLDKLKSNPNFKFNLKHSLVDIKKNKQIAFNFEAKEIIVDYDILFLALGGASWKKTGSDGSWMELLKKHNIECAPFEPMNCGFETDWSHHFISRIDRAPLKNVGLSIGKHSSRGEAMLTPFGIEGGVVYAISNHIRNEIKESGSAVLELDLKPDLSHEAILNKLQSRKPKDSLSNFLRKSLGIGKVENTLLKELVDIDCYNDLASLAQKIKALPVKLLRARPIDEAISTSGGVMFSEMDEYFQLKKMPGAFLAGEMLDFEAPTGGYLLQGCFSTAYRAVQGISSI